ncbi:MAG: site-specific DNA-methyltransferase [Candidatus Peribacteraceae bacterium]|nr:site-specific DNA-methyltransferase [Candidatus Peribacteraceae bacterium]
MPTLEWIGKKAVVKHHKEVPFHLLEVDEALSVGEGESENLIIQGDNLYALKALLPYYAGKVRCIYIDPPYNTGKENWKYNDNVNSPEIIEWLGDTVGKEAEDLSRHDKWLCMMYPRLLLAKQFLSEDGILFVSIDDIELPLLRLLLDELFSPAEGKNRLSCFVWQTEGNFDNQAKVKECHEYILAYTRNHKLFPAPPIIDPNIADGSKLFNSQIRNTIVKNGPKNPISEIFLPIGFPASFEEGTIKARDDLWPHFSEDLIIKDYMLQKPVAVKSGWSNKNLCNKFITSNFEPVLDTKKQITSFEIIRTGAIENVKIRSDQQSHVVSVLRDVGTTQQMSAELKEMGLNFDYPKPTKLIEYLISMIDDNEFIVMDFFAGSGTTGHAVLKTNLETDYNLKFILIELDEAISKDIMCSRITKVINGYEKVETSEKVSGTSGSFNYCTLGIPLFNKVGAISKEVTFSDLAKLVFFLEAGKPTTTSKHNSPLIGIDNGTAIYMLFNGILGDKTVNGGNVLTNPILKSLPEHDGPKVIYGEACRLGSDKLRKENITFKQIPYDVGVK